MTLKLVDPYLRGNDGWRDDAEVSGFPPSREWRLVRWRWSLWIRAFAAMTSGEMMLKSLDSRLRGNDGWGDDAEVSRFPPSREWRLERRRWSLWIPAFAAMTAGEMTLKSLDSRVRGNDVWGDDAEVFGFPPSREW